MDNRTYSILHPCCCKFAGILYLFHKKEDLYDFKSLTSDQFTCLNVNCEQPFIPFLNVF